MTGPRLNSQHRTIGLDFFGARYFSGAQGRFTSPDQPLIDQDPADPQSWNLYTYARNNPLRYVDPTGNAYCSYSSGSTPEGGAATTEKACMEGSGTWVYQPTDTDDPNADASAFWFSVTKTETGQLSESGQAVADQLAKNADPSMALIAVVAGGSATVGATAALAPVAVQAINELALGPAAGRLFWSQAAQGAAAISAKAGLGRTLDQTPLGSWWKATTAQMPNIQGLGWQVLSRPWASGAGGTVNVFASNPAARGTLMRVELPRLLQNPNVFKPLQYR